MFSGKEKRSLLSTPTDPPPTHNKRRWRKSEDSKFMLTGRVARRVCSLRLANDLTLHFPLGCFLTVSETGK